MKVKTVLILVLCIAIVACSQTDKIPKTVQKAFQKLYPDVAEVKWDQENEETFEASFQVDSVAISIVIDKTGKLLETETYLSAGALPDTVRAFVQINYPECQISEAARIVDSEGVVTYEAEVGNDSTKVDLMFDVAGLPLQKPAEAEEDAEGGENE